MKINKTQTWFATGLILAGLLLTACRDERSVEQQVIESLEIMELAAEEGRHLDFMAYVAEGFSGQLGSMTRNEFHRFMIFQINRNRRLHAQFFPIRVQERVGAKASAEFSILVTGGGGLLPERGQLYEVETDWVRDGNDWLLSKADWEPVDLSQLPVGGE